MALAPSAMAASFSTTDDPGFTYETTAAGGSYNALGSPYMTLKCAKGSSNNCNGYTDKRDAFLSGLPNILPPGNYFFAVVDPGGQNNPNDGSAGNLSSASGDPWTNREFTINTGGSITYTGTHAFDVAHNSIALFPFNDTTNNGGVYIATVCAVPSPPNPASGTGAPGVQNGNCKHDAFKVEPSGGTVNNASGLVITKDATGTDTRTYGWGITKAVDRASWNIAAGASATPNYTVEVTHNGGTVSNVQVNGHIQVFNPNTDSVDITGVTDQLSDGTVCTVTGGGAQTIPAGETDFAYTCALSSLPAGELDNTATVSWGDQTLPDDGPLTGGTQPYTFSNILFTDSQIIDGCVDVTDTNSATATLTQGSGALPATLCASDPSPTDFTYQESFSGKAGTCTDYPNTATFVAENDPSATNSADKTVTVCVGSDLTGSQDANPAFTRTFNWTIGKMVDGKSSVTYDQSSGARTLNYAVTVTNTGFTDSGWALSGQITVSNPNDFEAITGVNITDAVDNGGTCLVTAGTGLTIAASGSTSVGYSCTWPASGPTSASGNDTATISWASGQATPDTQITTTGTPFSFSTPTTNVDTCVDVIDAFNGATTADALGNFCADGTDTLPSGNPLGESVDNSTPGTFVISYSRSVNAPGGTCTTYPNTAGITQISSQTANASAKICVGLDLGVSKTAGTKFTHTYNWSIAKTGPSVFYGSGSIPYAVTAKETGFQDSAWQVSGSITVTNPNHWEDIQANVLDAVPDGGTCVVNGSTAGDGSFNVDVPAATSSGSGSVTEPYVCTYSSKPTGFGTQQMNTATGTWNATTYSTPDGSKSGTAPYTFSAPTTVVNKTITVQDVFNASPTPATLGMLTATDTMPYTSMTYNPTEPVTAVADQCNNVTNVAQIKETGQQSQVITTSVCGTVAGGLTIGFWQNKNGQGIITGGASTVGVCNSGTWLRQYLPFQDLSATATCSQVGTYVTNIIKAANASGAAMNAMLKAQMLATALDVYFSDPALGGSKIAAFNGSKVPLGGITVDLTHICVVTDNTSTGSGTCSGSALNASSAFGNATSLKISDILSYAASQSNSGGTAWYAQNKTTQGLAKDVFDAINNSVAFA